MQAAGRTEWLLAPCAHRLGERTKSPCNERVLSPRELVRQSPNCRAVLARPGSRIPAYGFIDRRLWTPHAFHEFDLKTRSRTNLFVGVIERGTRIGLLPFACPEHPSARRMTIDPVRTGRLHRRSTPRLVLPCGFAWTNGDKMPRIRFYNQRSASRAPVRTPSSETTRRSPWGNPAGSRLQDPSRARCFHRSFEQDAGPPRGHPASDGRVFDGTQTGFGPPGNSRVPLRIALSRRTQPDGQ